MGNNWQVTYDEIKGFVAQHPSIEIGMNVVSIPGDVRDDFYRLFDSLRADFVRDYFSASLEKAYALSSNHEKIRNELTTILGVEGIEVETSLNDFLRNPIGHVTNLLFDPLFDLLKSKSNLETFEEISTRKINVAFDTLLQQGYKSWLTLSLMRHMAPDAAYIVPLPNEVTDACDHDIGVPGTCHKQVPPDPVLANRLSFNATPFCPFLVPKVIIHSKLLNLFVSFLQEFRDVTGEAYSLSQQLEWYRLSELRSKIGRIRLWPDLAIYIARQPNELVIVADYHKMARPDIIVNIVQKNNLVEPGKPEMLKTQDKVFAPRLCSFVICPEPLTDADIETMKYQIQPETQQIEAVESRAKTGEHPESESTLPAPISSIGQSRDIKIIGVGYEAGKLELISNAIIQSRLYAELTSNQNTVA